MDAAVEDARRRLAALRAGRASVDLVADVRVSAWGSELPLAQVAQVGAQPPRGLVVTPHDPSLVAAVEKAIADSDLGARPRVDGQRIRIELPAPTDERRTQLARQAKEVAEEARVAVRLARRDCINEMKRERAADAISEAKLNGRSKDVQVWTDERIAAIDQLLATALTAIAE
jgi:ribosome recycling factor